MKKKDNEHRFLIFRSLKSSQEDIALLVLPAFLALGAYIAKTHELYYYALVAAVVVLVLKLLSTASLQFSRDGITCRRPLRKALHMKWEDVEYMGYTQRRYAGKMWDFIYFSKRSFSAPPDSTMPALSEDFLYLAPQAGLRGSLSTNWGKDNASNLWRTVPKSVDKAIQEGQSGQLHISVVIALLLAVACILISFEFDLKFMLYIGIIPGAYFIICTLAQMFGFHKK